MRLPFRIRATATRGHPGGASRPAKDSAADIGTRVYWLALLVGLTVGAIATVFHVLLDRAATLRGLLVGGGLDGLSALQWTTRWAAAVTVSLPAAWASSIEPEIVARAGLTLLVVTGVPRRRALARPPLCARGRRQRRPGDRGGAARPAAMRWRRILAVSSWAAAWRFGPASSSAAKGPTVQMGGAAAVGIAHRARCTPGEVNALLAAGAGAGIAAAFNAPIAGALFVAEELRREAPYNFQGYHAVLLACVAATMVTQAMAGVGPELRLDMAPPELVHYPWYGLLGVLLGAAGVLLNCMLLHALDFFAGLVAPGRLEPRPVPGDVPDPATVPAALGYRRWRADYPAHARPARRRGRPSGSFALRGLATVASYAAGAPGGVFAPILGLATVAGLAYGELLSLWLSQPGLQPAALAAAAMAALFTGSVRAPLVGVVLVAELTDGYPALLAITLSSAMASLTAARLGGRPLYELLLERSLSRS